jgi:hypothetical protein
MRKWKFLIPIGFLAIVAVFSAVVMLLWNWLMPTIFGLTTICFWQALGLLILCRIFFGRIGWKNRVRNMGHHHHNPIREKWQKMSEEERREFLKHRSHFGFGHDFFSPENGKNDESK